MPLNLHFHYTCKFSYLQSLSSFNPATKQEFLEQFRSVKFIIRSLHFLNIEFCHVNKSTWFRFLDCLFRASSKPSPPKSRHTIIKKIEFRSMNMIRCITKNGINNKRTTKEIRLRISNMDLNIRFAFFSWYLSPIGNDCTEFFRGFPERNPTIMLITAKRNSNTVCKYEFDFNWATMMIVIPLITLRYTSTGLSVTNHKTSSVLNVFSWVLLNFTVYNQQITSTLPGHKRS